MSETAGGCVYDGRPLDGVDVTTDEAGRIRVRGPMLMTGYRLQRELTEEVFEAGWLITSDLGMIDDDGRLQVAGRVDDVVITGGENVVTADVATVLGDHPDIAEVAVTGVDDTQWGQRLVAVVVTRAGSDGLTLAGLRAWSQERLAVAARPRGLVVVAEIPRLPSGKVDRRAISALAREASGDACGE
jgi:O-succinylbenzoic acid--CoA ligase